MTRTFPPLVLLLLISVGCYKVQPNDRPSQGIVTCAADSDCGTGERCVLRRCIPDDTPCTGAECVTPNDKPDPTVSTTMTPGGNDKSNDGQPVSTDADCGKYGTGPLLLDRNKHSVDGSQPKAVMFLIDVGREAWTVNPETTAIRIKEVYEALVSVLGEYKWDLSSLGIEIAGVVLGPSVDSDRCESYDWHKDPELYSSEGALYTLLVSPMTKTGFTNPLGSTLYKAGSGLFPRTNQRKHLVVFSFTGDECSVEHAGRNSAEMLVEHGVQTWVIGMKGHDDIGLLNQIALCGGTGKCHSNTGRTICFRGMPESPRQGLKEILLNISNAK